MRQIYVRFTRLIVGRNVFGPDEMAMQVSDGMTLYDVLMTMWNTKFLPDVRPYKVAWVALHEGMPIGLLAKGMHAPILFTNGRTPVEDYINKGSPVFFMADLGRKDSRSVLASFGRKVADGGDSAEAMNDVLESYLMINRKFSSGIKVAVSARGSKKDSHTFTLHSTAKLSDAVYAIYRNGCLPLERGCGPVWVVNSRVGALAVLAQAWAEKADARYLAGQEATLGSLFDEEENIELTLIGAAASDPDAVFEKLKKNDGQDKLDENGFGDGFMDRFGRKKY